jgi:hypothetical protein
MNSGSDALRIKHYRNATTAKSMLSNLQPCVPSCYGSSGAQVVFSRQVLDSFDSHPVSVSRSVPPVCTSTRLVCRSVDLDQDPSARTAALTMALIRLQITARPDGHRDLYDLCSLA